MYCNHCGRAIGDDAAFCQYCGVRVSAVPAVKRLMRSRFDKKIAGVCGGVARYFDLDPTLVRVLWLMCLLLAGAGGLLYVVMWIVVPEEPNALPAGA